MQLVDLQVFCSFVEVTLCLILCICHVKLCEYIVHHHGTCGSLIGLTKLFKVLVVNQVDTAVSVFLSLFGFPILLEKFLTLLSKSCLLA